MSDLKQWAVVERSFIQEEIKWLKAGGKVLSPSGDDITASMLKKLESRHEHANLVISNFQDADRTE